MTMPQGQEGANSDKLTLLRTGLPRGFRVEVLAGSAIKIVVTTAFAISALIGSVLIVQLRSEGGGYGPAIIVVVSAV